MKSNCAAIQSAGTATPFLDTTGVLSGEPQMADGNEKTCGLKIRRRYFAYRTIAFNEGVPKWVLLPSERNTTPEKYREIVSQISRTAFIEIEEHRLSGSRALQRYIRIVPVAIAVAARPGKSIPFCHRTRQSRDQINQPGAYGVTEVLKRQYGG